MNLTALCNRCKDPTREVEYDILGGICQPCWIDWWLEGIKSMSPEEKAEYRKEIEADCAEFKAWPDGARNRIIELSQQLCIAESLNEKRLQALDQYLTWASEQPCEYGTGKEDWDDGHGDPCVADDPKYRCLPCEARQLLHPMRPEEYEAARELGLSPDCPETRDPVRYFCKGCESVTSPGRWPGPTAQGCDNCGCDAGSIEVCTPEQARQWDEAHRHDNLPPQSKRILATVEDAVGNLLYYGRKEDEELPPGAIEEAIAQGDLTVEDMVEHFRTHLLQSLPDS